METESKDRMTEGPIAGKILRFAWPLFLGNLFQQLYNIADTLIVGNLLGNRALAAVSSTGSLVFLLISLFSGISIGAGVAISRFFGARDIKKMRLAVHTDLIFGLLAGLAVTVIGVVLSPQILIWMDTPPEVMEQSVDYLQVYFAGAMGLIMYNTCTGIMQAVGDSRHPLEYLIIFALAPAFMRAFTSEPKAIAIGVQRARICTLFYCLLACSHGVSAVLRGAGKAMIPMVTMLVFWCIVRVSFLTVMVPIFDNIAVVHWVYPLTWSLSTVTLAIYYLKSDWIHGFERS